MDGIAKELFVGAGLLVAGALTAYAFRNPSEYRVLSYILMAILAGVAVLSLGYSTGYLEALQSATDVVESHETRDKIRDIERPLLAQLRFVFWVAIANCYLWTLGYLPELIRHYARNGDDQQDDDK